MNKTIIIYILFQVLELKGIISKDLSDFISVVLDSYEEHLFNNEWFVVIKEYYNLFMVIIEMILY